MSLSHRNQSIDLQSKSIDWFLCERGTLTVKGLSKKRFYSLNILLLIKISSSSSKFSKTSRESIDSSSSTLFISEFAKKEKESFQKKQKKTRETKTFEHYLEGQKNIILLLQILTKVNKLIPKYFIDIAMVIKIYLFLFIHLLFIYN